MSLNSIRGRMQRKRPEPAGWQSLMNMYYTMKLLDYADANYLLLAWRVTLKEANKQSKCNRGWKIQGKESIASGKNLNCNGDTDNK